jgi:hypothetical protein
MKPLTAQTLLDLFSQLREEGHNLSKITINYRTNHYSDVEVCTCIEEDLFDEETNNELRSLVLMADILE